MVRTHYDNLQVTRNASPEVIKGAYKYLTQKWHPDKNPANKDEAARVLQVINRAHEVLSDPQLRKKHDDWIAQQESDVAASKHAPSSGPDVTVDAMNLKPGDVFAGYVIQREIGRGGMGAIYLALDPQFDRRVAIKLMNPGLVHDPMFLERFRKEARILGKFAHSHIVHIYGYGESQGQLWMVMQFVQAGSDADGLPTALDLGQRMTQAPLSVPDGLHILQGIARALDYIHTQGLVHRDLKPANILLDASGEAYLADFGIAKLLESTTHITTALGTPHYMSPEQCNGLVIGPPADIYALGVLAYQWLAQQLPFGANTQEPIAIAIAHLQQPMPEAPLTRWPPAVTTVLRQAMAKQAADRPPNARAFIDGLTAALSSSASARVLPNKIAYPVPPPVPANRQEPASKRWIVPVVIFAIAIGFGPLAYKHYRPQAMTAEEQYNLGVAYENGRGVPKDDIQAVAWLRKAAEQGFAKAQNHLGVLYADGQGVAKDEVQAVAWYRKAAEQGFAKAQSNLGGMYANGQGVAKDELQAVAWYRKAAEQGNADAQYFLGVMYEDGRGVPKDDIQAVAWYRKAAAQGLTIAQCFLGLMYENGRGVAKDEVEAVAWYRKAAEQGFAGAQYLLGVMYEDGRGVPKDDVQAVAWYRKAAEQGVAEAQLKLGSMYYSGEGVPKDYVQMVAWYRKAAEQGDAGAQCMLGLMYEYGVGVPKDDIQAVAWYRKAAEQGNADAQFKLGFMYKNGRGVAKDEVEAVAWYRKAAERGNADAKAALIRLGK